MSAGLTVPFTLQRALYAFGGRILAIDGGDEAAGAILASTYADLRSEGTRGAHHSATLRRMGDGRLNVRFDRRTLSAAEGAASEPLLSSYYALKEVFARFATGVPGSIAFYGALVSIGGAGVMLLGPSCSGKTLLALHLAAQGARFLGDETAALDLRTANVRALPRKPALRESALEFVPADMRAGILRAEHAAQTARGRFWYALDKTDLPGIAPSDRECRLASIFLLRDRAPQASVQATEPLRALPSLLQRAYLRPFQLLEISAVKRALRNVQVFDVQAGAPLETAALIMEQARTCG